MESVSGLHCADHNLENASPASRRVHGERHREGEGGETEGLNEEVEAGGERGGRGGGGERGVLMDIDIQRMQSVCGTSATDSDRVSSTEDEDPDICFSFITCQGATADTADRPADDVKGGETGTRTICATSPSQTPGLEPGRFVDAGPVQVKAGRHTGRITIAGSEEYEESSAASNIHSSALHVTTALPLPLPLPLKKQARFVLQGDAGAAVQVQPLSISISAPLSVSSCMASPTSSPSPGDSRDDRGEGWSETDHALFTKVIMLSLNASPAFLILTLSCL